MNLRIAIIFPLLLMVGLCRVLQGQHPSSPRRIISQDSVWVTQPPPLTLYYMQGTLGGRLVSAVISSREDDQGRHNYGWQEKDDQVFLLLARRRQFWTTLPHGRQMDIDLQSHNGYSKGSWGPGFWSLKGEQHTFRGNFTSRDSMHRDSLVLHLMDSIVGPSLHVCHLEGTRAYVQANPDSTSIHFSVSSDLPVIHSAELLKAMPGINDSLLNFLEPKLNGGLVAEQGLAAWADIETQELAGILRGLPREVWGEGRMDGYSLGRDLSVVMLKGGFLQARMDYSLLGSMLKGSFYPDFRTWDLMTGQRLRFCEVVDTTRWDAFLRTAYGAAQRQYMMDKNDSFIIDEDDFHWNKVSQRMEVQPFGICFSFGQFCCYYKDGEILGINMTWKELEPFMRKDSPLRRMLQ